MQRLDSNVFLYYRAYDCLIDIQFRLNRYKKVYMRASRLVFVLLEKLAEPFFELDQPSIGGNEKVKTRLTKTHNQHYILNLLEN
jgi:hypothetical protein